MIKLKNILNESWSQEYKDSIDCNNPKGFSQKAHCAGKEKKESVNEETSAETLQGLKEMAMGDLERIADYANMILERLGKGEELESWMYSQITLAVDQLNSVHDAMDGKDGVVESVNEENEPTNPELWDKAIAAAKREYDVYPSAYANAFASKWYKDKGGDWRVKKESVNEGVLQDRERKLKGLPNGAKVSGGGYGPFTKIASNTFKSSNDKLSNSEGLIKLIGTFKDFKIHETIKEESLLDLEKALRTHDWFYAYSDDSRRYNSGENNWNTIIRMVKSLKGKEAEKLWNKYVPKDFGYTYKKLSEGLLDEGMFKIGVKHIIPLIPTGYAPNDPKYKMDLRILRNMLNNFYKERGYEKVILPTF
jgi:hypothetical protein